MTFEENLIQYLLTQTDLTDVINDRIFPDNIPLKKIYPIIVYTIISDVEASTIVAGHFGLIRKSMQFSIYAETKTQVSDIKETMKTILKNYNNISFGDYHLQLTLIENDMSGYSDYSYYSHLEMLFIYT